MRTPSDELRAQLERRIHDDAQNQALGAGPQRQFADRHLLLIHGNDAFLWYLGLDGTIDSVDHDTVAMRLEPETDRKSIRAILEAAVRTYPELAELLEP